MPLDSAQVGATTAAITHQVDARWLMAYAAGLGDNGACYLDTRTGPVLAHPVFPACLEWPAILASRELAGQVQLSAGERARGVHAAHDLHLLRPIRAGETLSTTATVVAVRAVRPGAAQLLRLDTVDVAGALVCRTYQTSILRGVAVAGGDQVLEEAPAVPSAALADDSATEHAIAVSATAAHVYTECARIWNPIHTDRAVAVAAGLPDIILHGTATLALAVSRLVESHAGGDPSRVRRLGCRFSAMVPMPNTLCLSVRDAGTGVVVFSVTTEAGEEAVRDGFLVYE